MNSDNNTNKLKLARGLIIQKMSQETVIFDSERAILFTLNETAGYMFVKLKRKTPLAEIIRAVCKRYQISESRAKKDLELMLKQLQRKKILFEAPQKRQPNLRTKKNRQAKP